jgi:putative MATE family efflux protein
MTTQAAARTVPTAENPILRNPNLRAVTLSLAWPVFISRLLHTVFHLANIAWVGRIGADQIAAVTTSIFVLWTVQSLAGMVSIGATSIMARHFGAGDRLEAARTAGQALFAGVILGVLVSLAGVLGAGELFRRITDDPNVIREGTLYLRTTTGFSLSIFLLFLGEAMFRASGNTRTPMTVLLVSLGLNLALDPFLILGWGPFPRMGVAGAAIATVSTQALGVLIYAVLLLRKRMPFTVREMFSGFKPRPAQIRKLLSIGAPITAIGILFSIVYIGLSRLAAGYGTGILAALGIVNRIEGLSFLTAEGFGVAATTMAGQNLGAGLVERADRLIRTARRWSVGLTGLYGLIYFLFPAFILGLFTRDPEVIRRGSLFLMIVATAQPFMGIEIALEGGLAGAGDTRPAMFIAVPLSLIRIPVAIWLAGPLGLGAVSIWWTITVTAIVRGVLLEIWFRRGAWKSRVPPLGDLAQTSPPSADNR